MFKFTALALKDLKPKTEKWIFIILTVAFKLVNCIWEELNSAS